MLLQSGDFLVVANFILLWFISEKFDFWFLNLESFFLVYWDSLGHRGDLWMCSLQGVIFLSHKDFSRAVSRWTFVFYKAGAIRFKDPIARSVHINRVVGYGFVDEWLVPPLVMLLYTDPLFVRLYPFWLPLYNWYFRWHFVFWKYVYFVACPIFFISGGAYFTLPFGLYFMGFPHILWVFYVLLQNSRRHPVTLPGQSQPSVVHFSSLVISVIPWDRLPSFLQNFLEDFSPMFYEDLEGRVPCPRVDLACHDPSNVFAAF